MIFRNRILYGVVLITFFGMVLFTSAECSAYNKKTVTKSAKFTRIKKKEKRPFKVVVVDGEISESTPSKPTPNKPIPKSDSSSLFIWPVDGKINSAYGPRRGSRHEGIDVSGKSGTKIVAAAAGEVTRNQYIRGYGKTVILSHADNFYTIYAHCKTTKIKVGQRVKQGQTIALVGRTGHATGPHLHFEIRKGRVAKDPMAYLPVRNQQDSELYARATKGESESSTQRGGRSKSSKKSGLTASRMSTSRGGGIEKFIPADRREPKQAQFKKVR